jgi:hypothetical protein
MNKVVEIEIKGTSGLLMHAFPLSEPPKGWEKWEPAEQARIAEYRTPEGALYVPGVAIQRCLVAAAAYSKGKGRTTLQKPIAACVLVAPEHVVLTPQSYTIDSRPVVIPATKGRIMRHRPYFRQWSLTFRAEYDPALLSEKELRQVVDDAGSRVGLLDFRPEKKGPFGRFMIVTWRG